MAYSNANKVVTLKEQKKAPEVLRKFLKSKNVADEIDEEELNSIGRRVVDEYEIDLNSRSHREKQIDIAMDLAMLVKRSKNFPWPGASNVKYPLITHAAIQFASRAYPALVKGDKVVAGKVVGNDDGTPQPVIDPQTQQPAVNPETGQPAVQMVGAGQKRERAERTSTYMNFQLLAQMPDWESDLDRMLHILPIVGSMFKKTYYDPMMGRPSSDLIMPKHFVINNAAKSLESASRYTQEFELFPNEIEERTRSGVYREIEYNKAEPQEERSDYKKKKKSSDYADDPNAPHFFLEQHTYLDLDEDGYAEPYVVTVHKTSNQVVRIFPRFNLDSIEVNARGQVARIIADQYFTKFGFVPSADGGIYDTGFGELLYPINETINSLINQLLDAGTLQNTGGGFVGKGLRIRGGAIKQKMGSYTVVDSTGGSIKDNIVPIPHADPSMVLFQMLGSLIEAGKDIASVKDILSGEQMANQAATSTLAMIEQGITSFKAIYKRLYRSQKEEFKKLYKLNARFLSDVDYQNVLDIPGASARQDFNVGSMDIIPVSDPDVVTDAQRMAKAQLLMELRGDPTLDSTEIVNRLFDAANIEDRAQLMAKQAPPPDIDVIKEKNRSEEKQLEIKSKRDNDKSRNENEKAKLDFESDKAKEEIQQEQEKIEQKDRELDIRVKELELKKLALEQQLMNMEQTEINEMTAALNNATAALQASGEGDDGSSERAEALAMLTETTKAFTEAVKNMDKPKRFVRNKQTGEVIGSESVESLEEKPENEE